MKICLVSDNLVGYHETWSGAEMVVQYLDNLLKKNGRESVLLTVKSKKKETPENIFTLPALNGRLWAFKKIIPIHILIRTISALFLLRKMKPDVLHFFHSNSLFLPVMISARILKIPATFTVLDYWIICPTGHCLLKSQDICPEREGKVCLKCVPLPKFFERLLARSLIKDLKYFVTFTETSRKRLIERGFSPEKIKVEYIYEFSFDDNIEPPEKIFRPHDILFVGTAKKQKGLHVVISSLPYVISKIPDARLVVVGRSESEDKERIERLVKRLKLENNVKFWGQKPNKEVLKIISRANLLVVAEQWFSDFGPVVLAEAMALGALVVSGDLGSPPDLIKDGSNGFLAEYNNPESFAEKIILALQDKEKSRQMGQKAKETIKNYFSGNREQKIVNLYV